MFLSMVKAPLQSQRACLITKHFTGVGSPFILQLLRARGGGLVLTFKRAEWEAVEKPKLSMAKKHDVFGFLGRSHTDAIILAREMYRALVAPCATLKILILLQSTVPERICREWNTSPLTSVPYLELSSKRKVSKLESTNYEQDSATGNHLQTSLNCCSEIGKGQKYLKMKPWTIQRNKKSEQTFCLSEWHCCHKTLTTFTKYSYYKL